MTRVWELRDRRLTAFRGDYCAYHRQREERDARAVKDADTQAEQIARERELVQRYRSHRKFTQDARARAPPRAAPGGAPGGARRPAGSWRSLPRRWPATGPSRSGEIVVRAEDLAVGYLPGRGAMAADGSAATRPRGSWRERRSSPRSAASGSASSGRTAPARRRSCGRSPASCRRSTAR